MTITSILFVYSNDIIIVWASLVPRPFEEEEKGSGAHCLHMRGVFCIFSSKIDCKRNLPRGSLKDSHISRSKVNIIYYSTILAIDEEFMVKKYDDI